MAPRSLFLSIVVLALLSGEVAATECDDIFSGAQIGPPPDWTFWADGSACFVRWHEDSDSEEMLLTRCRTVIGARFVDFEKDKGSGAICLFKIMELARVPAPEKPLTVGKTPKPSPTPARAGTFSKPQTPSTANKGATARVGPKINSNKKIMRRKKHSIASKTTLRIKPTATRAASSASAQATNTQVHHSGRTEVQVNGKPYLVKPSSSECFEAVYLCKPK